MTLKLCVLTQILMAVVTTVAVGFGGHVYSWELIVWAWTASVWAGGMLLGVLASERDPWKARRR